MKGREATSHRPRLFVMPCRHEISTGQVSDQRAIVAPVREVSTLSSSCAGVVLLAELVLNRLQLI